MLIVKTTGSFGLCDYTQGAFYIEPERACVVRSTQFIQHRISLGQLTLLAEAPKEATDEDFQVFLKDSDGDEALAIESFLSSFSAPEVVEEPKKRATKKKVDE